jgi:hypothetical protein
LATAASIYGRLSALAAKKLALALTVPRVVAIVDKGGGFEHPLLIWGRRS